MERDLSTFKPIVINIICCITFCLLIQIQGTNAQLANTPWPTFGQNAKNTNVSPYVGPSLDSINWEYSLNGVINESPIIGPNGFMYIGHRNTLYALKPGGELNWKYEQRGGYGAVSPAIGQDSTLYFGTESNKLIALNKNGNRKWSFDMGYYTIMAPPTVGPSGTIYFGSVSGGYEVTGRLYAIAPAGTLKWKYSV